MDLRVKDSSCVMRHASQVRRAARTWDAGRLSHDARRMTRVAMILATTAMLTLAPGAAQAQDSGIEVGARAPDAALETLDGKAARLSQWVGKQPVVMEFWATWCPNCKQLEPHLAAMHRKYGKQVQFVTVAVSINQTPARVKQYVAKYRTPGVVLFDRKGEASGAYDVAATSYIVIVDRSGKVVYTGVGGKQALEQGIRNAMQGAAPSR